MTAFRWALAASLLAAPVLAHEAGSTASDPVAVAASRVAAEAYYDFDAALAAGYEPLFDCIDAGPDGAMGQHFINPGFAGDGELVMGEPDVLMYEPQADGSMHLVALEYVVFQQQWQGEVPPRLLGRELQLKDHVGTHLVNPLWELHVWHWRSNPAGLTADYNTEVSCEHAS